jgi:hypothetical protein
MEPVSVSAPHALECPLPCVYAKMAGLLGSERKSICPFRAFSKFSYVSWANYDLLSRAFALAILACRWASGSGASAVLPIGNVLYASLSVHQRSVPRANSDCDVNTRNVTGWHL